MGKVICIKTRQEVTETRPMELAEIQKSLVFLRQQLDAHGMVKVARDCGMVAKAVHNECVIDAIQAVAAVACQAKTQE